jgi:hypothetical protein
MARTYKPSRCSVPGCKNPGNFSSALNKKTDKLMDFCEPCTKEIRRLIANGTIEGPEKKRSNMYRITETVTIQTYVTAADEEKDRSAAYKRLPDYGRAGWDLINSDGPEIKEVEL